MSLRNLTNFPLVNASEANSRENLTTRGNGSDVTTSSPGVVQDGDGGDPELYLYDVGTKLFLVIDMFLVLMGCLGNFITLLVSLRKNLRRSPVSLYIAALAISDILVLVLDFLNNWLDLQFNIYLMGDIPFCLFHRWFFNVAYTTSAWLVAAVAFERFLGVWFPLTAKVWCTRRRTVITIITIPVLLCVIYTYNFWTWHVAAGKCDVLPYHAPFMNNVSPWLTATLYSYIPLAIILFCSGAILYRLFKARQKRADMTSETANDNSQKITITILAICAAFICLTIPLTVWYLWVFATQQFIEQTARIVFIEICILIVGLSNHTVNFFLYVTTSERFRKELKAMFSCTSEARLGGKTAGKADDKSLSTQKTSAASSEQSINTVCSSP